MIVYADVLVFLNLIVDYLLLCVTEKIVKIKPSVLRMVSSALIGAASSLYIFFPQSGILAESAVKLLFCGLMTLVAFGFGGIKSFLRKMGTLFLVTCAYGGIMIAVWYMFKPYGMVVNNSVVYFNISPTVLITVSVAAYVAFIVLTRIFSVSSKFAEKCRIKVTANGNNTEFCAIVDTGNSIEDIFGKSEVIIVDKECAKRLFGTLDSNSPQLRPRYRVLPCGTVSGDGMLDGYRCDSAVVTSDTKTVTLEKPILAISKLPLKDGYSGIINPKTIY